MTEGTIDRVAGGGWLGALEQRPYGVVTLALALAALLIAGMLAWWAIFGLWETLFDPAEPFGLSFDGRNHLTLCLILGFVASGVRWNRRVVERILWSLEGVSALPSGVFAEQVARTVQPTRGSSIVSLVAATIVGVGVIVLTSPDPGSRVRSIGWGAHDVWAIATNVVLFTLMMQGAFRARAGWQALERIVASLSRIDLLERDQLVEIGRFGLPGAVIWLVGSSLASTLAWGASRAWPLFTILSATLLLAAFSLLRPAQIAHRRLRDEKRAELRRVRERIRDAKDGALASGQEDGRAAAAAARLPGLLAYEARIESVREWPFDTPTLVRAAALAVLAVGSWLGGAVVERALTAVLE